MIQLWSYRETYNLNYLAFALGAFFASALIDVPLMLACMAVDYLTVSCGIEVAELLGL